MVCSLGYAILKPQMLRDADSVIYDRNTQMYLCKFATLCHQPSQLFQGHPTRI